MSCLIFGPSIYFAAPQSFGNINKSHNNIYVISGGRPYMPAPHMGAKPNVSIYSRECNPFGDMQTLLFLLLVLNESSRRTESSREGRHFYQDMGGSHRPERNTYETKSNSYNAGENQEDHLPKKTNPMAEKFNNAFAPCSNKNELKKVYHKLSLEHHPDKNPDRKEEATEEFKLLTELYNKRLKEMN
ncbi:hypothetical protein GCM10023116_05620 [Kistimonas scapharcae]|uniref:J domain-containing protein n=1 Tax=Kistimonas scapharcae TaxID=1036133 RepID=A0ABP8UYV8_9GAMM